MIRHVRKKVVSVAVSPNTSTDETSRRLYPERATATLECGHTVFLGIERDGQRYRPKRCACAECPGSRRV